MKNLLAVANLPALNCRIGKHTIWILFYDIP